MFKFGSEVLDHWIGVNNLPLANNKMRRKIHSQNRQVQENMELWNTHVDLHMKYNIKAPNTWPTTSTICGKDLKTNSKIETLK